MISLINKYRAIPAAFLLPLIIYTGVLFSWTIESTGFYSRYVDETAYSEAVFGNFVSSSINGSEKKVQSQDSAVRLSYIKSYNVGLIKESAYKLSLNKESENNFRLYPFLSSHFATST
jgi:hypothetical protein